MTIQEAFSNFNAIEYFKENFKTKENNVDNNDSNLYKYNDIIKQYYINKFYFEEKKNLFIDNKIAEIYEVKIIPPINNKKELYNEKKDNSLLLAIDENFSIFDVYLDVTIYYKKNINDTIPIRDKIICAGKCLQHARTIDAILAGMLGVAHFREGTFEGQFKLIKTFNKKESPEQVSSKQVSPEEVSFLEKDEKYNKLLTGGFKINNTKKYKSSNHNLQKTYKILNKLYK